MVVPAIAGHDNHARRSQVQQPVCLVRLKLLADEDVTVFKEAGMKAILLSRLARVVEEAYYQGAVLDACRLCLLFVLSARTLRATPGGAVVGGSLAAGSGDGEGPPGQAAGVAGCPGHEALPGRPGFRPATARTLPKRGALAMLVAGVSPAGGPPGPRAGRTGQLQWAAGGVVTSLAGAVGPVGR